MKAKVHKFSQKYKSRLDNAAVLPWQVNDLLFENKDLDLLSTSSPLDLYFEFYNKMYSNFYMFHLYWY